MKTTIVLDDGQHLVEIDARDRRAFERDARTHLGAVAVGDLREVARAIPETYVAWLAWHAAGREGALDMGWPEFEARLLDVRSEEEDGGDGLDPTRPGPTAG